MFDAMGGMYQATLDKSSLDFLPNLWPNRRMKAKKRYAEFAARRREILRLRRSGKLLHEIGAMYGITRERVRQLIMAAEKEARS